MLESIDLSVSNVSYDGTPSILGISGCGKLSMRLSGVGTVVIVGDEGYGSAVMVVIGIVVGNANVIELAKVLYNFALCCRLDLVA